MLNHYSLFFHLHKHRHLMDTKQPYASGPPLQVRETCSFPVYCSCGVLPPNQSQPGITTHTGFHGHGPGPKKVPTVLRQVHVKKNCKLGAKPGMK